jgi:phage recombination protein Bet
VSNVAIIEPRQVKSVTFDMADRFKMEPAAFEATMRATVFPANGSREQFAAFLLVAREYDLNPITKEIFAFPAKGGGIVPVVSVDGWLKLINSHPQFDGMELVDSHDDKGELLSTQCSLWRKDRSRPTVVTEYLSECVRPTEPWKMKHRMLRHKALIQAARYAFGFAGIYDQDEGERIVEAIDAPAIPTPPTPPSLPPVPMNVGNPGGPLPAHMEKVAEMPSRSERGEFVDKTGVEIPLGALNDFHQFQNALDSCPTLDSLNAMYEALTKNMADPNDLDEADAILREVASKFPIEDEQPAAKKDATDEHANQPVANRSQPAAADYRGPF